MYKLITFRVNNNIVQNLQRFASLSSSLTCDYNKFELKKDYSTLSSKLVRENNSFNTGVVTSSLGNVKVPNENLVEHVWKNCDKWGDKPAAVSTNNF